METRRTAPSGLRSFLFAPGNHPRKVEKVFSAGADVVILDLEDAVAVAEKESTRATVVSQVDGIPQDRFFRNEAELDRVRETLDLFEKAAELESGGKLDIQLELKTDSVPFYRFPGQKADPLVSSIEGRFNEAFDFLVDRRQRHIHAA